MLRYPLEYTKIAATIKTWAKFRFAPAPSPGREFLTERKKSRLLLSSDSAVQHSHFGLAYLAPPVATTIEQHLDYTHAGAASWF